VPLHEFLHQRKTRPRAPAKLSVRAQPAEQLEDLLAVLGAIPIPLSRTKIAGVRSPPAPTPRGLDSLVL